MRQHVVRIEFSNALGHRNSLIVAVFSFLAGVRVRHMRKIPGGDWILTRIAATAAKAAGQASRDFNAGLNISSNVNAPKVSRKRKSARSHFSSCRLSFLFMMVVRSHPHALPCPFSVERDQRPPAGAVAKSLPVVAHRDLLRSKDEADRLPGVLGIHVAGTRQSLALPQMDR